MTNEKDSMTIDPCPHCGYCPHCKRSTRDFAPYVPYVPTVPNYPWVYPYICQPITVTWGDTMTTAPAFPNTTTYLMNPALTAAAAAPTYSGWDGGAVSSHTTSLSADDPNTTCTDGPCDHCAEAA